MKNFLKFIITFMVISIVASCAKHSSDRTTTPTYLTATSGTIGSFSSAGALLSAGGAMGAKLEIDASSSTGATLSLWLNPYSGATGTWPLSSIGSSVAGVIYYPVSGSIITSVHGNLILTAVAPNIVGTFTYTGSDSAVVTGSFNVVAP